MSQKCSLCAKAPGFLSPVQFVAIQGKEYCSDCAKKYIDNEISKIPITTTHHIDGFRVKRYIDIESVEVVIGTGLFSEFTGQFADFFGTRSTAFETKLQQGKIAAFKKLKFKAYEKGGNAVIGVDIDYAEFSGNRMGIIVNGTIVEIEPYT